MRVLYIVLDDFHTALLLYPPIYVHKIVFYPPHLPTHSVPCRRQMSYKGLGAENGARSVRGHVRQRDPLPPDRGGRDRGYPGGGRAAVACRGDGAPEEAQGSRQTLLAHQNQGTVLVRQGD